MVRRAVLLGALALAAPTLARAEGPITDRDYAIDFYEGVAIGNTASVGMGGAGVASQDRNIAASIGFRH